MTAFRCPGCARFQFCSGPIPGVSPCTRHVGKLAQAAVLANIERRQPEGAAKLLHDAMQREVVSP